MTTYRYDPHAFTASTVQTIVIIGLVAGIAIFAAVLFPWI